MNLSLKNGVDFSLKMLAYVVLSSYSVEVIENSEIETALRTTLSGMRMGQITNVLRYFSGCMLAHTKLHSGPHLELGVFASADARSTAIRGARTKKQKLALMARLVDAALHAGIVDAEDVTEMIELEAEDLF